LRTTQITRDSVPKIKVLTDGSRIYVIEIIGTKSILVQASVTSGQTSPIPVAFSSVWLSDISPDNAELLVDDATGIGVGDYQAWVLPLPNGSPRHLGDIVGHEAVWSSDGKQIAFGKGSDIFLANSLGQSNVKSSPRLARQARFDSRRMALACGSQFQISKQTPVRSGKCAPTVATFIRFCLAGPSKVRSVAVFGVRTVATIYLFTAKTKSMPVVSRAGYSAPHPSRSP
jgi:hypothetical protein